MAVWTVPGFSSPSLRGRPFIEAGRRPRRCGPGFCSPSLRGRPFIEAQRPDRGTTGGATLAVPSGTALHRGLTPPDDYSCTRCSPSLRGRPFIEARHPSVERLRAGLAVPSGTALHRGGGHTCPGPGPRAAPRRPFGDGPSSRHRLRRCRSRRGRASRHRRAMGDFNTAFELPGTIRPGTPALRTQQQPLPSSRPVSTASADLLLDVGILASLLFHYPELDRSRVVEELTGQGYPSEPTTLV